MIFKDKDDNDRIVVLGALDGGFSFTARSGDGSQMVMVFLTKEKVQELAAFLDPRPEDERWTGRIDENAARVGK